VNEDENQNEAKGKSHGGTLSAAILAVFLVGYFAFPVVLFIPTIVLRRVCGHVPATYKRIARVVMHPVGYMGRNVAWYGKMVDAEANFAFKAIGAYDSDIETVGETL